MKILFIRHAITDWNLEKKLQGRTDISLALQGIEDIRHWQLPASIKHWYVSPLLRTQQTANYAKIQNFITDERLIEMNWGAWEGKTLAQLRQLQPIRMRINEAKGLDFCPDEGESPRQVRQRLSDWLMQLNDQSDTGVITHKGVIRCAFSIADDWDMQTKHPIKIMHNTAYAFAWKNKKLTFERLISLIR